MLVGLEREKSFCFALMPSFGCTWIKKGRRSGNNGDIFFFVSFLNGQCLRLCGCEYIYWWLLLVALPDSGSDEICVPALPKFVSILLHPLWYFFPLVGIKHSLLFILSVLDLLPLFLFQLPNVLCFTFKTRPLCRTGFRCKGGASSDGKSWCSMGYQ